MGAFVIIQEVPFWGSRASTLWQVLTALGVGLVVLAVGLYKNAQKSRVRGVRNPQVQG